MGVYVHIPFCAQKCNYCDFHSVVVRGKENFSQTVDNYLLLLREEAVYYGSRWRNKTIETLFIGGGTPSILPPDKLASLIFFLQKSLPFAAKPEISIEANPHSLSLEGIEKLVLAGVNRISLGAQAFQDDLLKKLGRLHSSMQIKESVHMLRKAGIKNINLDLMFGLPYQTKEDWLFTLESALALEPQHLSCYGLILEGNTPLAQKVAQGSLVVPDDDLQAEMYELTSDILKKAGYEHYEVANFCQPGFECKHNLLYWQNKEFIALGSGATGYIDRHRYRNIPDLEKYMEAWSKGTPLYAECEEVSLEQEMDETMMVGMRLLKGISETKFRERYNVSFRDIYAEAINGLLSKGLVEYVEGSLRVTDRGLLLENQVSGAFLR